MNNNEIKNNGLESVSDENLTKVAGGAGGQIISSGSFVSQTGTALNILVNWSAVQSGGTKTLNVTVSALTYALHSSALYNTVSVSVNGMTYYGTPNAVNYDGSTQATFPLASFSIPNAFGPAQLTATWNFNGVISGIPVGAITATGVATF